MHQILHISPSSPLASLRVSKHYIPAHNGLPNTSILNKPLLIYHGALQGNDGQCATASAVEAHLVSVGVVTPQWRYSMYPTTHFHSTSHEVLCVTSGRAELWFGGEDNPDRVEAVVQVGDVMILPAGLAHRLSRDVSQDGHSFEMVGSYPTGCHWDMCYGKAGEEEKVRKIAGLSWFTKDPIFGHHGPVLDV
ncbi:hypothetical protein M406DRAFT_65788 [Cryphonectria parasitica EP155]|uniref:Cupin type-2 domain-containing protein n=1 Tax=Cryphonectria parasitica (strain ATCC 38755 / EP155) TaxID=660469 RepID=A0A9P4XT18_CRYP1|nr:uncharacterized protein M406DRAFT_65788 [Cryphonectria parasitica EP155]KAF3760388.1 hypothetical protein M406DRAFT_65788 [Cryphonectria parasitica EP155]